MSTKRKSLAMLTALTLSVCAVPMYRDFPVQAITNEEMVAQQLSMPIVSIDTLGNSVTTKEYYVDAQVTIYDENGAVNIDASDISIRLRGNMTLNAPKKSYRIKFPAKQNPLTIGDGAAKSWNLVANYHDASLMRNMTAYQLGEIMDNMPYAANGRSVEVYVNGDYQGVYFLVESVNVNKNRVNITESPDLVEDNGYLIQMSRYAEDNVFTVDCCNYEVKSDVSADAAIAEQQVDYIADYTEKALHALKSGDQEAVAQYIDIPSLIDNCIANEICKNVDSGWDSYYMSKDAGGKLTFNPMWDYDLALGNNTEAKGVAEPEGLCIYNITDSCANSNPWLCYAIECDWFRELLRERWDEKLAELQTISDFVVNEAEQNLASYDRNFERWNLLGSAIYNEPEEIAALTTHKAHAEYLADWLDTRIAWLDDYYHSDEFTDGVLLDENNEPVDTSNIIANSPLMMWGMDGEVDTDSPGFTAAASNGWGGQALATGLMLQSGQKYKLSFEYTAPETASVNFRFQKNYGNYASIWGDSVTCNGSTQTFEAEFTPDVTDTNVAFVMEFKGSGTVKVEKLSLIPLEAVKGDVNADGEFTVADVAALQKWLLAVPDVKLADWKAGNLCNDDRLDVCDLCIMKRELLKSN